VSDDGTEDEQLRSVTLENARSIFLARQRAEEELVRTKDELAKQSERLRVTLNSIADAVVTTGLDGRVLTLNGVAEGLCGWTEQEARGRELAEVFRIVDEDTRQPVEDPAVRALREGRVVGLTNHTVLVARDGTETPIDDSVAPIRDDEGRVHGVVLVFRSVAERKRSELAQARLAAIVESSQDAIIGKTLDSRIVSWNAGAEYLFGYRAEEAIGQPITMLIPPERQDEERVIIERLRRGERVEHYDTVRLTKAGRRVEVSLTISPIRDGAGRIVGASKIARDVTARKRAEQRLSAQNRVAAALAESAELADASPRILRSICGSLEWEVGALWLVDETHSALRCADVYHVPSVAVPLFEAASRQARFARGAGLLGRVWATAAAAWVPDVSGEGGFERARAARDEGLHSILAFPIHIDSRVLGVLEFFSQEVREPDEVMLRVMRSIGSQVGQFIERRRAEAALREANRRKDVFLAMLSHELRNPLAAISNAVQIFRARGPAVPELQWATELIDRQLHHMTRMVDDLLDVSRITQGKVELRKEPVELATVVSTAVEASRPLIEKWGHRLTVTVPPAPIRLDADPTRLAQVITNLLNNAAKYTGHGGRIALCAEQEGGWVEVRVKDDGIGIPGEMLSRVFDLFTQVDGSRAHAEGGLGIGLTLVRRLVEMHGGAVEAKSEGVGKGSEFVVRLPVGAPARGDGRKGIEGGEPAPAALRILVVDDNRDAADSLGMVLRMMGHEVEIAHDGLEAVGAATSFRPDVALLDIGLPKLDGYEVASRIRKQHPAGGIVLVALTGWGQEEDRQRAREAGFDHHLTKPVEFKVLQKMLVKANPHPAA
jgi:PAS domain S-box-containing protein